VVIPILYLKGISTGDFEEPLAALLGNGAPGLSASNIARLKGLTPCPEYRPAWGRARDYPDGENPRAV